MQQFFLSCHAYQWEFVTFIYTSWRTKKKYSCHLILLKKPPKDKRPSKSLPWKARIFANSYLISIFLCFTKTQVDTYFRHRIHSGDSRRKLLYCKQGATKCLPNTQLQPSLVSVKSAGQHCVRFIQNNAPCYSYFLFFYVSYYCALCNLPPVADSP